LTTLAATAAGVPSTDFPLPVDSYHDQQIPSIFEKLAHRIQREPLNLIATVIFFAAIIHTFLTAQFRKIARHYQRRYEAIEKLLPATASPPDFGNEHDRLIFRAQLFHFMGEVEAVFGMWLVPLFVAIFAFHGWSTMVDYVGQVNVSDAIFVVVIMAIAGSLPILRFTETVIAKVSALGKGTPVSWWSIDPGVAIWRGRNFAAVPFPRCSGADADRRSCVYTASLSARVKNPCSLRHRSRPQLAACKDRRHLLPR
jgi:hypothetical protein